MAAAAEVQALLRFLSQDAKVPLAACLSKVGDLRKAQLNTAESIAKSDIKSISAIFTEEKVAKQVFNAAKRLTNPKKRAASSSSTTTPTKLAKGADGTAQTSEAALELPKSEVDEETLSRMTLQTNRAPLVLAFAVTMLKYTMPEQPLSSRLSLAQAVVSANSQSKAKSIGITNENTAEEEGWGKGQPKIRVLGREIAVMRRAPTQTGSAREGANEESLKTEDSQQGNHETFWGLDLDALRKSNGPLIAGKNSGSGTGLPIYTAESARNYLLRSMTVVEEKDESQVEGPYVKTEKLSPSSKKSSAKDLAVQKEQAAAHLLHTLDLLFASWAHLSKAELDRRAWSWYLNVRPDIAQGQAGWGQKGQVQLSDILKLKKESS